MMALPSATTTFTSTGNQGVQVVHNSGSIQVHIQAPERPETPPQPSCFVPFRRDADFVDHGALLDKIRERCSTPAACVALVGLGGVGKSQLAIEHCYRTAEQSPDMWVFWAHASNTARLEQSFRVIADQIRACGRKDPQVDVFKLVHDWLRDMKNGRWLIVLDNVDDAAVLSSAGDSALQQRLSKYIPSSSRHGSVLMTSRTKSAVREVVDEIDIILIKPMDDVAAHALLRKKLRDVDEEDESIATLAKTLDHIPLALVQAAAYIRERAPRCSVRQYLEEYQQSGDYRKTSLLSKQVAGYLRRDGAASNSILKTWQISFNHLHSTKQSAADLLSLMSFFDRQRIQESLLHRKSSAADDGFEDDLLALRDYSFITITRDADTFEMHNLVQLAMRTWLENEGQLESEGQLDKWREQFISNLCAELPTGEYKNWEKCQALYPHARAALAQKPKNRESLKKWALLLYRAAWYAWQRGRVDEAEEMAIMSMEARREEPKEDEVIILSSMAMVGLIKEFGGKYEEAEVILRQTLAGYEKVLGHEHPSTLTSMGSLALVLDSQSKYEEAEPMSRKTLEWRERVLGHEHPDTLISMNNLAAVLYRQYKYEEAEAILRQTLVKYEVLGYEHPDVLLSMNILALILDSQGKCEEAEAIYRKTLGQRQRVLGYEHPYTQISVNNLVAVLKKQRKYEAAEEVLRQTLQVYKEVLGHEHLETLTSMNNLALMLYSQEKYEEAEMINKETLVGYKKVLGQRHLDTLISMNNLALALNRQCKYEEAEVINRETLALREEIYGPDHEDTLMSMNNLAAVLNRQGKYEEAETMHRRTLAGYEKVLGHDHQNTLTSVYFLAHLLTQRCQYNEALTLYKRACAGFEAVLGKDHPTTHACHQHYTDALASHEQQNRALLPTAKSSASTRRGKESKLLRGLAKLGIGL